jgi:uncharacterized protein (DUF302 family)
MTASNIGSQYGYVRPANIGFEDAVAGTEAALKSEGFGVLCQIDIRSKLKEKLNIDFPRYVILGACNPALAHRALEVEMNLGLLLPCNAIVYEREGQVFVGVIDAVKMLSIMGNPTMEGFAREVNEKLRRAVDRVTAGSSG